MDINLQLASLVDGRVEEGKEALCQYSSVSMLNADLTIKSWLTTGGGVAPDG
jgi:hypothetical protein